MNVTKATTIKSILLLYTLVVLGLFVGLGSTFSGGEVQAVQEGDFCSTASDCHDLECEYPLNTYCTARSEESDQNSRCTCRHWNNQPFNGCEADPFAEPPTCPTGYTSCGVSGNHDADAGCLRGDAITGDNSLMIEVRCKSCNNPSNIYRYCRATEEPPVPQCYEFCTNDSGCAPGLVCDYSRGQVCVNPEFPDEEDCVPDVQPPAQCYENCDPSIGCQGNLECRDLEGDDRGNICVNPEVPFEEDCTPDVTQPFCGDGICATGEQCERAGNTFRECTTVGQAPNGQVVSSCRDVLGSAEQQPTALSCTFCGDGIRQNNEECDYAVDANCNLNCTLQDLQEGITITKDVIDDRVYLVGEQIRFRVRVTNTGETTLNTVRFRDSWDPTYLRYLGGSVTKSTGDRINDISPLITSQTRSEIIINDVTNSILGDLRTGQYYEFELVFSALAPTPDNNPETCNDAFVRGDDLPEVSDDDCAPIDNQDTDI